MNWKFPIEYYKDLRPHNLTSEKYRHVFLALFWPIFGIFFWTAETLWPRIWHAVTGEPLVYQEVVSTLDAYIPFCEWFVIPYYFWFAFLVGMGFYSFLYDIRTFRHFSWFVILTYTVTIVIYFIWPNMQGLRPVAFERDNWMIEIVRRLYDFDTNTNVCPSIHVLGSLAAGFAGLHSRSFRGWGWKVFFVLSMILISLSTVFLKQHSILDVIWALVLSAVCYPLVFFVICRDRSQKEHAV